MQVRTARAVDIAAMHALLLHAKDDAARHWWRHWEFEPGASDPFHLLLLMKDIEAIAGEN